VIVTAAGQGIGRAIVDRFVANGAKVFACDVQPDLLDKLQSEQPTVGVGIADISNAEQVAAFFGKATETLGGLDVLVNNAGIGGPRGALEDIATEDWDRTVSVNLNGTFYCIREAAKHMKPQNSGCIVNISTGSVRTGLPMRAPYVASKQGVMGLTHNVARELGPFNIRCNAILPGLIDNARGRALIQRAADEAGKTFEQTEAEMLQYISMRCWIDPTEIGDTAVFLASHAARHISGQFLGVCGNIEWEI
jgi:NAD(P)-dependent dehydrogenase (short-subunit alcohol dehydrogenase family)